MLCQTYGVRIMASRSDKLFQKRRAKTAKQISRKTPSLVPRERILIVTEGQVTEVHYFNHIKARLRLPNIDIDVCGSEFGSSPRSIVNYAEKRTNSEGASETGGYDRVYCVFDRDTHSDFESALSRVIALNKKSSKFCAGYIEAVWSNPCFEVWLIYHFAFSRKPFLETGSKSASKNAASELTKYTDFHNYDKHLSENQLLKLENKTPLAVANAKRAFADYKATGEANPSTKVHVLVEYLWGLRKEQ